MGLRTNPTPKELAHEVRTANDHLRIQIIHPTTDEGLLTRSNKLIDFYYLAWLWIFGFVIVFREEARRCSMKWNRET